MVEQPKASPGWYSDPEQPGNENWWDGDAWTDQSRPIAVASAPVSTTPKSFWWFLIIAPIAIVGIIVANVLGQTWNQDEVAPPRAGSSVDAPPVDTAPDFPAGYQDSGSGVAFKWVTTGVDCSYFDRCVVAEFYAYTACPRSLYVEAAVLDENNTIIDTTNELSTSLRVGDKAQVLLGWMDKRGTSARLTEVNCY